MKRVQNFRRKRPHMLPPLLDLPHSGLTSMGPLQPPDLLLMESRLGSPTPKRSGPIESDFMYDGNNGKPLIKISEPYPKENEKCNLKFDLLQDSISNDENDFLHRFQKRNSLSVYELESKFCERENLKNLSRKQFDYLRDDLNKKLKLHSVLPLEDADLKAITEHKILSIPSRYTPLKPIGQEYIEH